MLLYLNKKIAVPHGLNVRSVAWNHVDGWIAFGGDNGVLKVLSMEPADGAESRLMGVGAPSNLTMNQPLEEHTAPVTLVSWNESYRRLTSADDTGLIIVWALRNGEWTKDMVNDRRKSPVVGAHWSPDGQHILIVYKDGHYLIGSITGARVVSKGLEHGLTGACWCPSSREFVLASDDGRLLHLDLQGQLLGEIDRVAVRDLPDARVARLAWYDGLEGTAAAGAPTLCIAFECGRMQLLRSATDAGHVLVDTGMHITDAKWSPNGQVLAITGRQRGDATKPVYMVQLYSPFGDHISSLKLPGNAHLASLAWQGGGLRIALAVGASLYFANVRPDYRFAALRDGTLVYACRSPGRDDDTLVFWHPAHAHKHIVRVPRLRAIAGAGRHVLVSAVDRRGPQLTIYNSIGSVAGKFPLSFSPSMLSVATGRDEGAPEVAVAADARCAALLRISADGSVAPFTTSSQAAPGATSTVAVASAADGQGEELTPIEWVVGKLPLAPGAALEVAALSASQVDVPDPVTAVAAHALGVLLLRASGTCVAVDAETALPRPSVNIACRTRPVRAALSCDGTGLAVLDFTGVLSLFRMAPSVSAVPTDDSGSVGVVSPSVGATGIIPVPDFNRKDVWDFVWAEDSASQLAVMEKTRLVVLKAADTLKPQADEPKASAGFLARLADLELTCVLFDEVFRDPLNPESDSVLSVETRALRDTRRIIDSVGVRDAFSFVESNPHPRLWKMLAAAALREPDFVSAEKAFVRCKDFSGLQFVKKVRAIEKTVLQKAEVAVFLGAFDEADALFASIDRPDLALRLHHSLGNWPRVLQLAGAGSETGSAPTSGASAGDDSVVAEARSQLAQYYGERDRWDLAAPLFRQAGDLSGLATALFRTEDYEALVNLVKEAPSSDTELLSRIARMLTGVGALDGAIDAHLKTGSADGALQACVSLRRWDRAVEIARQFGLRERLAEPLAAHTKQLLEFGSIFAAVELLRRTDRPGEAARLLFNLARERLADAEFAQDLVSTRMLLVLAGRVLEGDDAAAAAVLGDADDDIASIWASAEALHHFCLAQALLHAESPQQAIFPAARAAAISTAAPLGTIPEGPAARLVSPFVPRENALGVLAVAAISANDWSLSSIALAGLENREGAAPARRAAFADLAVTLFTSHPPDGGDSGDEDTHSEFCPRCNAPMAPFEHFCDECGHVLQACVATGVPLRAGMDTFQCNTCHRSMLSVEADELTACPLCHSALPSTIN
jgi:WD repeat-containing protein 35